MEWMQEVISALDRAATEIDFLFDGTKIRATRLLAAGDPAAVSAVTGGSTRTDAAPTAFTAAYLAATRVISHELDSACSQIRVEVSATRREIAAVLDAALTVSAAPPAYDSASKARKGRASTGSTYQWRTAPVEAGASVAMPYRAFPDAIDAEAVLERAGADHAAAAVLAVLAEHQPAALHLYLARPEDPAAWGVNVHLPGLDPIWVDASLPTHNGQAAGIVSADRSCYGVEFIAKGYAMAQATGKVPRLDTTPTSVSARSRVAMETFTGMLAFEQELHFFDDESVLDEVRQAALVVACTDAIDRHHPRYAAARASQLITGREQAYAVRGVDDEDRVRLYHPLGYSFAVSAPDFRDLFSHLVVGTAPVVPEPATATPQQLEHLARHLAR